MAEDVDWAKWADRIVDDAAQGPPLPPAQSEADKRREALRQSGLCLPKHTEDMLLTDLCKDTLAMRSVREFAQGSEAFLLMSGPSGRGKTMACGYLVARHGGHALTGTDLVRLHTAFEKEDVKRREIAHGAALIVLDELAREDEPLKHEKAAVFAFVHARQRAGLRTLITTNRGPLDLYKRYEDISFNRLLEQGKVVKLNAEPDYRMQYIQEQGRWP